MNRLPLSTVSCLSLLLVLVACGGAESTDAPSDLELSDIEQIIESGDEEAALSEAVTEAPEETLRLAIEEELGRSNRDVPRLTDVIVDDAEGVILVRWAVNEGYDELLIADGAMKDTWAILRVIDESTIPYQQARLSGSYPLDGEESNVANVFYDAETVAGLDFSDDLEYMWVWEKAEDAAINPALRAALEKE